MIQLFLIDLLFILLPFSRFTGSEVAVAAGQQDDCKSCHEDLLGKDLIHYPAGDDCMNCHESTGAPHPSGDSAGFRLIDRVPELCLSCHNQDYRTDSSETTNIHRLVRGKMKAHSAIEGGGCISCHRAHGSDRHSLLVEDYPEEDYLPALTENFELCFLCHDTDLMLAEETEWGTAFRNGKRNLHWLHINGNKGRNCRMCHNIHGSSQPFLVEELVGFGNWEMRMNFVPEEQGGSCLPGCHGKLSYQR